METNETQAILKDLIQITNDRISAFAKVEGQIWESYPDIKSEYEKMISHTNVMKNELVNILRENDSEMNEDSSSVRGNIHSTWIDIKSAFNIDSVNSTLNSVISEEEAAYKAYEKALETEGFSVETKSVLEDHLYHLKQSHKQFREILEYRQNKD
ncbi:PA2169 family four-helix-bundle protein [Chryseobacterium foetidum]|uniref:PA2169 family four-helix-bundle protein n=1 Tax=Chryseobacterium foetidum TaxID=2951057 RepID=UPI0021C8C3BD|nr:PA2169 family four-helix-bundle protein [Chryseobacterium foetidum]